MRLTTKGRYAVLAMLDVAQHQAEGPVPLAEVAERQFLSQSYLEQLFAKLRKGGLVLSTRGTNGGYRLAEPVDKISISSIIRVIDETVDATQCGGSENCHNGERCSAHFLWTGLNEVIRDFLSRISLADLLASDQACKIEQHIQWFTQQGAQK